VEKEAEVDHPPELEMEVTQAYVAEVPFPPKEN
jgi:hypothetical protein